jgi:hypothetical protein
MFYDRTRKRWSLNKGDCLIEVSAWEGLTVLTLHKTDISFSQFVISSWTCCTRFFNKLAENERVKYNTIYHSIRLTSCDYHVDVNIFHSRSLLGSSWSWLYGSWIYSYLCNQCISPLKLWIRTPTLCDKVYITYACKKKVIVGQILIYIIYMYLTW